MANEGSRRFSEKGLGHEKAALSGGSVASDQLVGLRVSQAPAGNISVMLGHLATDPGVTLKLRSQQRRTCSSEGINNPPALLTDPHQLTHQLGRLAGHVVLVGPTHRLADHTRQHRRPPLQRHVALAPPHHVFGLVAEAAQLRPHARDAKSKPTR